MYYESSDSLAHYGVKGMKWGVRRYTDKSGNLTAAGKARHEYKDARKQRKAAGKALRKASYGIGIKGIDRYQKAEKAYNKADMNVVNAKAKYNAAKAKNADKAAKAEFKTYRKEMSKTGLAGSAMDQQNRGRSTTLYNEIKVKKGKEYADRVSKSVQNRAYAQLAGSAVVMAGSYAAAAYLNSR